MPRVAPSRARRSKPEIEKEFSKIAEEQEHQREIANPKAEELARVREAELRQAVGGIGVEQVVRQLEDAKRQVQDIAVKAIEGASGAKALTDVKQVLMEQAKSRSPLRIARNKAGATEGVRPKTSD